MSAGQLAKYTGLTSGAVTGLIDRLEKKNLVKRAFDPADRRKIIIVPNKENTTKLLGASFKELQNKIVAHISTMPDHERIVIEKYLLATIDIMNGIRKNLDNK
jgi:DNA-binding transcriptional regulator GbsR (MarR family)